MENPTRRRPTLAHQLGTAEATMVESLSPNLRDLLKVREADDEIRTHNHRLHHPRVQGVTLATVLACEKQSVLPPSSSSSTSSSTFSPVPATNSGGRTLLDVIRDEGGSGSGSGSGTSLAVRNGNNNRIFWKSFKNRLRLRRTVAGTASVSSTSTTVASSPVSLPIPQNAVAITTATTVTSRRQTETVEGQSPASPIRVSFMTLLELEETDDGRLSFENHGGQNPHTSSSSIAAAMIGVVEEDSEEEEEEEEGKLGSNRNKKDNIVQNCCVCMVRRKGAAFIPCGHTFCRICSRELWISRGNCPICNGFILEILDIF
ncbi:RING/U-box superfamily protein [Zostera marina]|uniref:RING/U-box superfamily protein n=1 Tax=Zostera marina TaxID=29655 RepID=A0A0K9Q2Z9_ZOSMR|nr:RING/U-box superfamily protein [Zostera marina]